MTRRSRRFGATLVIALVAAGVLGAAAPLELRSPALLDSRAPVTVGAPVAYALGSVPAPGPGVTPGKKAEGTAPYEPGYLESGLNYVMNKIASLFAWFLGVAAIILDYVVFYTVIQMGDFVTDIAGVGVAWRILRDIGNIAIIFGFIATGIAIIISYDIYGSRTKMIPMLLIAAVFLNFSFFISSTIIDVGNLFATQIYTQINNGTAPTPATMRGGFLTSVSNEGISNKIMSVLGLAEIYETGANDKSKANKDGTITGGVLNGSGPWYIGFMAILLFLIATFVFLSLAFILIARFVALVFLIVVAPLGFAGLAIPKLAGLARQWWSQLVEQTLTAPVLLLLLYVALAVITDTNFLLKAGGLGGGGTAATGAWKGFLDNQPVALADFGSILMGFLIAMGLLLAVVVVSKRMSAFGAGAAIKLGGKLSGLSLAAAAPGAIGRNTIGLAALSGGRAWRKTSLSRVPVLGRSVSGVLDRGAKASFDMRPTSGVAKAFGADISVGSRQKGGAAESEKQAIKARETHAKSLELNRAEKDDADRAQAELDRLKDRSSAGISEEEKERRRREVEAQEKVVIELRNKAQLEYARKIEWQPGFWRLWPIGKGRYVNEKAATNIRREARKKPSARDLESALRAAVEEERGAAGGGGTGAGEGGAGGAGGAGAGGGAA